MSELPLLATSSFPHEIGHHFGLHHTFQAAGTKTTPVVPLQLDHPERQLDGNGQLIPEWWGRELVIRQTIDDPLAPEPFKTANSDFAGDLITDTPADCQPGHLGCPAAAQSLIDCSFNSTLTYTDYNEYPIYPPPTNHSLGRNFMSYWNPFCRNEFTTKQAENMAYWHENYRKPKYATEKCGHFNDKVEFEGSETGIPTVTIRVRHSNDSRICNVTTNPDGNFSGILHNDLYKARIYHNGKGALTGYSNNNDLTARYKHLPCEWLRGITTYDLLKIKRHILGLETLPSGYSKIAADVNKSGSITTFDIVELRKLILGIYDVLPVLEQPWRFIPEFVLQDYATTFNNTPFSMTIGSNYVGAAYLDQDWEHTAPASLTKRGFDAVKIGDVNSSWPDDNICDMEKGQVPDPGKVVLLVPSVSLDKEEKVKLQFKAGNFSDVVGFQIGLQFDPEQIEVMDIEDTNEVLDKYEKEDYFGLTESEDGLVRTLWFDTGKQCWNRKQILKPVVTRLTYSDWVI